MIRRKVFVVQDTGKVNLLPALRFGEVEVLTDKILGTFTNPAAAIEEIINKVRDGMRPEDYLLLVGDPLLIGVAFHAAAMEYGVVDLLKWDRQEKQYYKVRVSVPRSTLK